jgi:hypothetical protein
MFVAVPPSGRAVVKVRQGLFFSGSREHISLLIGQLDVEHILRHLALDPRQAL